MCCCPQPSLEQGLGAHVTTGNTTHASLPLGGFGEAFPPLPTSCCLHPICGAEDTVSSPSMALGALTAGVPAAHTLFMAQALCAEPRQSDTSVSSQFPSRAIAAAPNSYVPHE